MGKEHKRYNTLVKLTHVMIKADHDVLQGIIVLHDTVQLSRNIKRN